MWRYKIDGCSVRMEFILLGLVEPSVELGNRGVDICELSDHPIELHLDLCLGVHFLN